MLLGAFIGMAIMASAQVNDYAFSQSNGTYTAITGSTIFSSGWDDNLGTYNIPSGTFTFNGTAYNYVKVNSNGYVTFGSTTSSSSSNTPISSTTGYAGAISAFGYDLTSNSSTVVATQSGGEVIIQWNNARRYSFGAVTGDVLNWQIRLNQTTGAIKIVYGTCTATSTTTRNVEVGLRGTSNSDYNNRSSSSNWSSTTAGGSNSSTVASKNTIMPSSGLTFTWSPPKDIGPTALALPTALSCFTNAQPVSVMITNQGTTMLNFTTSPVTVTANVTGATTASLSGTLSTGTLTAGSSVNVPMSATLNMSAGGDYNFALSTSMSGDTDPSNDNASDSRTSVAPTGVTATSSAATVCAGNTVNLFSSGTAAAQMVIGQDFNGASIPTGWTKVNSSTGGTTANADWTLRADAYSYSFATYHSNDNSRFYMSNSDAQGSGSTTNTSLTSPVFSLAGMSSASLSFYQYYRYNSGAESANIQVSTNGSSWTTIQSYNSTIGGPSAFALATIALNAYVGQATVQVRFLYSATWDYYWALDNFEVNATPAVAYSWTSTPSGFTSSLQNPTSVSVGVNTTYKVTVTAGGCSSTAQVVVNTVAPPNAGTNGTLTICAGSTVTAPQLLAKLGGTPNAGGSWSPALAGAGTYTYTVTAVAPCAVNATAQVVVSQQAQPNAGSNGTLTICAGSTVTAPQLFAKLGGTPNAGGSWSPALAGAGTYTYTVNATSPCTLNATAQVVVSQQAQPNAGTNGTLMICAGSTVTAPQLFAALGGTPNAGGSWSPTFAGAGTYTYTVNAITPCAVNATAQVVVSEQAQPNAGSNGTLTICAGSTVTTLQLVAALGGTPDGGGSWSPALAGAGTYTYTVAAIAPCAVNATAQVVVSEQQQPIAGTNGALTICEGSTVTAPQLFAELNGTPDAGGNWSPALAGAGTYTYTVIAIAPCAVNATAQVVVSEQAQPNAGSNASFVTCNGSAPFSLLSLLGAGAQGGGTWSGPSAVLGNMYDASTMDPGTYTYTVSAATPCVGSASATVSVSESGNQVVLRINTDGHADQTSWILMDGTSNVIATGGPFTAAQNNSQVDETLCLSNANGSCYSLKLLDSFGDGLNGVGSWQLRTATGKVLLGDDFANGSASPAAVPMTPSYVSHSFCLPPGNTNIAARSCGVFNSTMNSLVHCTNAPGATSYQFEFSDPDAGFIRRIAVPTSQVRFNQMVTSPLTPGVKYFVRVRNNGSGLIADAHFGGGCELGMSSTIPCTELISAPAYGHSCNELRSFNTNNSFIYANPVVGATEYQFRITIPSEGYDQTFIRSTYILQLKWNATVAPPLVNGSTYNVQVNAKVGTLYSGFCGDICTITIDNSIPRPEASMGQANGTTTMWPNPVRDGQVNLSIDGIQDMDQQIAVDIQDIYGKKVFAKEFGNSGERFNTILDLPSGIASGVYMVNITVNGKSTVQRLSIVR